MSILMARAILQKILITFCRLVPRNKRIWIFGSRDGQHYDENSKALFEYVNERALTIRPIWLTRNKVIYNHIKEKGYEVYYTSSFYGCIYSLIAGVAVISVSLEDVNKRLSYGTRVIQLWHGTPLRNNDISYIGEDYDAVILAAEEFLTTQKMSEKRNFNYVLSGYPRHDTLFSTHKTEKIERLKLHYQFDKMVLYAPTHRERLFPDGKKVWMLEFDMFSSYGFNFEQLEDVMRRTRSLFVLKLHPVQKISDKNLQDRINKSKFVHLVDSGDPLLDVYDYLLHTDVLVTDYSSAYFNFLLLNRPIIFAAFDYESQLMIRSMRFPYEEVTPGPKAKNWTELCEWLDMIIQGRDDWVKWRQIVNQRFNAYRDGGSCERVYDQIRKLTGV